MNLSLDSITSIIAPIRKILSHHAMISFLLVMITLILCVFSIQQITNLPTDTQYSAELDAKRPNPRFDQKTLEKINQLRTNENTDPIQMPSGHYNPLTVE